MAIFNGRSYPAWFLEFRRRLGDRPRPRRVRFAVAVMVLAALAGYVLPGLTAPAAHWPMWDVSVYWQGGQQAARGGAVYAPAGHFTYPPFAAALFAIGADAPVSALKAVLTAGSICALAVLCWQSLGAAGVRRRPETMLAVTALALLTVPVGYTLHLGEVNLILAALVGADVLARRDGGWWQGIATGLAAGIKLTPLIFVAYLLVTRRIRAAATAAAAFAATVTAGAVLLPSQSWLFWLHGLFLDQDRIGNPANPANQSLSGAVARLTGNLDAVYPWWAAAALITGLAGLTVAVGAHRRGHRLAGVACCGITGVLVSPFSWTHHWIWAIPLLISLTAAAWHRSPGYALAAAAAAVVFSGLIRIPPPGPQPNLARLLQDDLYVLCGLSVLAGTAVTVAREHKAALSV